MEKVLKDLRDSEKIEENPMSRVSIKKLDTIFNRKKTLNVGLPKNDPKSENYSFGTDPSMRSN